MLRINLLPPYIYEGARRRNVMVLWAIILLVVIGGFVYAKMSIDGQTAALVDEKERLTPDANKADQLQAQANQINQESAEIRAKRDFVKNARIYNSTTYQPVVYNIRDYTMRGILYSSFQPSGQTVTLTAYAQSLADVGRYLMWMEHNPDISHVSISLSGLPSFPVPPGFNGQPQGAGLRPPGAGGYDFSVALTLVKPIPSAPTFGGAGGGAAGGGGMPGMPGPGGFTAPGGFSAPGGMGSTSMGMGQAMMSQMGSPGGGPPSTPMASSAGMQQAGK